MTKHTNTALALILSSSLMLSACAFGGKKGDDGSSVEDGAGNQTVTIQSNTDGGAGGAVVSNDEGVSTAGDGEAHPSTKTGFDDLWLLDAVSSSDGTRLYDDQDVLYYGTTYEMVCAIELYGEDDDSDKLFALTIPGIDLIGVWSENGDLDATLSVPISDTESDKVGSFVMSDDRQTAELTLDGDGDDPLFVCSFHRDDDTSISLDDMYDAMVENNDEFFDSLPVLPLSEEGDEPITFVDDDNVTMTLVGKTKSEGDGEDGGLVGYLIDVTNKTDSFLILNDFSDIEASFFTINGGDTPMKALTGRVLPPMLTDEETGEEMVATMRCAILFSSEDVGDAIESCSGNLLVTDYHWEEVGRYPFSI